VIGPKDCQVMNSKPSDPQQRRRVCMMWPVTAAGSQWNQDRSIDHRPTDRPIKSKSNQIKSGWTRELVCVSVRYLWLQLVLSRIKPSLQTGSVSLQIIQTQHSLLHTDTHAQTGRRTDRQINRQTEQSVRCLAVLQTDTDTKAQTQTQTERNRHI